MQVAMKQPERLPSIPRPRIDTSTCSSRRSRGKGDNSSKAPEAFDPSTLRIAKLATPGAVATELGRLYRRAARRQIPIDEAKGLASILRELRETLEGSDIMHRIEQLKEAG